MKHRMDPKIDCVFKALLGSVENRNLPVHFLNAILAADLTAPITGAEPLNPMLRCFWTNNSAWWMSKLRTATDGFTRLKSSY